MASDLDIYRSARPLTGKHSGEAPIHAAMRAGELLEAGDMDGVTAWKRILRAVDELLAKEKPGGGRYTDRLAVVTSAPVTGQSGRLN